MNSNTSVESLTTSMEQPSRPSNSTLESPLPSASPLEPTMPPQIQLPTSPTGATESNQILIPSVLDSPPKSETNSASPSSNLRSNAKPHALLDEPPKIRVLKVSKEDINALCQVITEFQEQFVGY
jgi:hypothetical protein